MKNETNTMYGVNGLFPIPVYMGKRDLELDSIEKKEIENIIKKGMYRNAGNSTSNDSYIFNGKLKKLKQFCEEQLNIYVEQTINPKEELDFYITQSWLNITKPGEHHHEHAHPNSIISGVFYISAEEDDKITFNDINIKVKGNVLFELKEFNIWNSTTWFFPVNNNELVLFPSWLDHKVEPNEKATTDRISISFNTFIKGHLGIRKNLTELIL
jgi:uncharacterized protein (TIGR02466 family)